MPMSLLAGLVDGAHTARAQGEPSRHAIDLQGHLLQIRRPHAIRTTLRMADVMA